jgi:flavin reductase (DIM6/NTAB) family NADH-FMN oxidoreductase RutF
VSQTQAEIKEIMAKNIVEPIVFVLTKSADGKVNFMPCGWNMKVSGDPPTLAISLFKNASSHDVVMDTREFVVSVPNGDMNDLLMYSAGAHGDVVDKVAGSGVEMSDSTEVSPPRIASARASYECRVTATVDCGEATLVVAEIVHAHSSASPDQLYYSHKSPDKERIFYTATDTWAQ